MGSWVTADALAFHVSPTLNVKCPRTPPLPTLPASTSALHSRPRPTLPCASSPGRPSRQAPKEDLSRAHAARLAMMDVLLGMAHL